MQSDRLSVGRSHALCSNAGFGCPFGKRAELWFFVGDADNGRSVLFRPSSLAVTKQWLYARVLFGRPDEKHEAGGGIHGPFGSMG